MRVAVGHDWLYTIGGAERVLTSILRCSPGADLHCLFDVMGPEERRRIGYYRRMTSFLHIRPPASQVVPLMPIAIEQLDLSVYDLVFSSTFAVAKGVPTGPNQLHIAYVSSPVRHAWDQRHQYLKQSRVAHGVTGTIA